MTFAANAVRLRSLQDFVCRYVSEAQTILDIGCGDGELLRRLCSHYRAIGTGIDTDPGFPNTPDVTIIAEDFRTWGNSESFDLVIATGILHLLEMSDDVLLAKLIASVAPNGWLVYDLPVRNITKRICGERCERFVVPPVIESS
jgi:trans-aconitate methyltransferase